MNVLAFARDLPKVELHCHLEGLGPTVDHRRPRAPPTASPSRPTIRPSCSSSPISTRSSRSTASSAPSLRHRRRLPPHHLRGARGRGRGQRPVPRDVLLARVPAGARRADRDGVGRHPGGLADAHHDLDVKCRIILDVDKPAGPARPRELIEFAGEQDRDLLIGVGGDSTERGVDHRAFAPRSPRAAELGLRRTFHAGEDGPADNIAARVRRPRLRTHRPRLPAARRPRPHRADRRRPRPAYRVPDQQRRHRQRHRRRRRPSRSPVSARRACWSRSTPMIPGMMGTTICDDYEAVTDRVPVRRRHHRGHRPRRHRRQLGPRRRAGGAARPVRGRDGRAPGAARVGAALHLTARMPS